MRQGREIEVCGRERRGNLEGPRVMPGGRVRLALLPIKVPPEVRYEWFAESIQALSGIVKQPVEIPATGLLRTGRRFAIGIDEPALGLNHARRLRSSESYDMSAQREHQ